MPKNNEPVHRVKIFPITVAIWRNEKGENVWYSVTVERTYKDGEDYKSTGSLNRDDLLPAAKCIDQAHSWIVKTEAKEYAERSGS